MHEYKFLITGGAGFIGSHLVDRLLENGRRVICDDFNDYYYPELKPISGLIGKTWISAW